jgi:hypothetical protein
MGNGTDERDVTGMKGWDWDEGKSYESLLFWVMGVFFWDGHDHELGKGTLL